MVHVLQTRIIRSFHVVVLQGTPKKCTKLYNAHAQLLFCSLILWFSNVPVAVAVVGSITSRRSGKEPALPAEIEPIAVVVYLKLGTH